MSATFKIDYEQMLKLEDKMAQYSGNVEEAVNRVIHDRGAKLIVMNIIGFMPRSKKNKPHAKDNPRSVFVENFNLGATFSEGGNFAYLIFPEAGLGKRNPVEQAFFLEGVEASHEVIMDWIMEAMEYTPIF